MPRVTPATPSAETTPTAPPSEHEGERGDHPETARVSDGWWGYDEVEAYRLAASTQRGVLIDVSAIWCIPCVRMDRETFRDPQLRAQIISSFVPLRIDVSEETMANREQLRRYRVGRLPAIIFVDAAGRQLDRIDRYVDATALQQRVVLAARALPGSQSSPQR